MIFQPQMRVPGPTPIPERVLRSASRPMVDHRGPDFKAVLEEVVPGIKRVFDTENDVLVFTASGTGGLESAVANVVSPGDKVVCCICGNFGERFAAIADAYGCETVRLEAEWGQPVEPADLERTLEAHPDTKLVLITHNETSTGLTNGLAQLAAVVRSAGPLLAVDGVSSVGSIPIEVDKNGIDIGVTASQKGFLAPPGAAFVSISERAWKASERATAPRVYFDWKASKKSLEDGATPFTPAISVFYAVQEGLRMLQEEGLPNVYARQRRIAGGVAAGLDALGFELFAADGYRSPVVTAALPPAGADANGLRKQLREKYGVVIAGGQGKMSGKMVRIGHLGAVQESDMVQVLWSVEQALEDLDVRPSDGHGVQALTAAMAGHAALRA
ncbi:MAG: alanine--glyoxylate aminotransferase family protein [Candidatus Dormibacteraeota bacterium]|nr:alanine--glyoxylate aminotransferase family protein [Candidatus Dormibacteraeota bacterium]